MSYTCHFCKKRILTSSPRKAKSYGVEPNKAYHLECFQRSKKLKAPNKNRKMYKQEEETKTEETETPTEETASE